MEGDFTYDFEALGRRIRRREGARHVKRTGKITSGNHAVEGRDIYTCGQAARLLGVNEKSIRRWENRGWIHPKRTSGGHRRFSEADIKRMRIFVRKRRRKS